jgi:hypothetical protein
VSNNFSSKVLLVDEKSEAVTFNTKTLKYHKPSCPAAKRCSVNCISTTRKKAIEVRGTPSRNVGVSREMAVKYLFLLTSLMSSCTKSSELGKYQYGLYYSEGVHEYSDEQRLAVFDSSIQDIIAQKNCKSTVDVRRVFPIKKG